MGKTLSIIAGLLLVTGNVAGQNQPITNNVKQIKTQYYTVSKTEFIDLETRYTGKKSLELAVYDTRTSVRAIDHNSDGFNVGDLLVIDHNFETGEKLHVTLRNLAVHGYKIDGTIKRGDTIIRKADFNTDKKWIKILFRGNLSALAIAGKNFYGRIMSAFETNSEPNLPYWETKKIIGELEKELPNIKPDKRNGELNRLAEECLELAKSVQKDQKIQFGPYSPIDLIIPTKPIN
jgi:hypothetical protein